MMKIPTFPLILLFMLLHTTTSILLPVRRFHLRGLSFVGPIKTNRGSEEAWKILTSVSPEFGVFDHPRLQFYHPLLKQGEIVDKFFFYQRLNHVLSSNHMSVIWVPDVIWDLYHILMGRDSRISKESLPAAYADFVQFMQDEHLEYTHVMDPNRVVDVRMFARILVDLLKRIVDKYADGDVNGKYRWFKEELDLVGDCFAVTSRHLGMPEEDTCHSMLVKAVDMEIHARMSNKMVLFRYSPGYQIEDLESDSYSKVFDVPVLLSSDGLYYATSLLSGFGKTSTVDHLMAAEGHGYIYGIEIDKEWFIEHGRQYLYLLDKTGSLLKGQSILFDPVYDVKAAHAWESLTLETHSFVNDDDDDMKNNVKQLAENYAKLCQE